MELSTLAPASVASQEDVGSLDRPIAVVSPADKPICRQKQEGEPVEAGRQRRATLPSWLWPMKSAAEALPAQRFPM